MSDAVNALERAELQAMADFYRAASPATATEVGIAVHEVAGAVLMTVTAADVLAMNRLVGLGLEQPASAEAVAEGLEAVRASGVPRCFVPVAPRDGHDTLAERLTSLGLRHYNNWMRLSRDLSGTEDGGTEGSGATSVVVDLVAHSGRETFGRIVAQGFGYPAVMERWLVESVGRPSWSHYLATDEGRPVGAAAMFVCGEAAWFGFAATDASARRRGVQRALILRRLADARAAGCRWVSVETAEDTVVRDAPSFRNLRRLGFEIAYRRPNYLWTRAV